MHGSFWTRCVIKPRMHLVQMSSLVERGRVYGTSSRAVWCANTTPYFSLLDVS
ncbi:Uncharacterised protein [Mycobacteroides abscessus subsp. abscessus]|nr:Uncharacterised protein [Mycobacteroides abscessus subsp. abscessus]